MGSAGSLVLSLHRPRRGDALPETDCTETGTKLNTEGEMDAPTPLSVVWPSYGDCLDSTDLAKRHQVVCCNRRPIFFSPQVDNFQMRLLRMEVTHGVVPAPRHICC